MRHRARRTAPRSCSYRAAGNPPSTLPHSAISNCFPGLEFDFRNVWRRMFVGHRDARGRQLRALAGPSAELAAARCAHRHPLVERRADRRGAGGSAAPGRPLGHSANPDGVTVDGVVERPGRGAARDRAGRTGAAASSSHAPRGSRHSHAEEPSSCLRCGRSFGAPRAAARRIDEELRAARRADAEPLLAVAERLPRVRVLLLGREPAGLRERRAGPQRREHRQQVAAEAARAPRAYVLDNRRTRG